MNKCRNILNHTFDLHPLKRFLLLDVRHTSHQTKTFPLYIITVLTNCSSKWCYLDGSLLKAPRWTPHLTHTHSPTHCGGVHTPSGAAEHTHTRTKLHSQWHQIKMLHVSLTAVTILQLHVDRVLCYVQILKPIVTKHVII